MGSTSTLSAAVKPLRKEGGVSNSPVPSQPARGMRRRRRSQVGDVGVGENAGDVGGLHDRVGAVGRGEGLVVAERVEAELAREGGERQRRQDLGVDGVGQPARPLEARPVPAPAPAGAGVHGRNPRCGGRREEGSNSHRNSLVAEVEVVRFDLSFNFDKWRWWG
jgi:hypothetical protein